MPFYFTCPYCFKKTLVEESLAGREGNCAGCGKLIVVAEKPKSQPEEFYPVGGGQAVALTPERPDMRYVAWGLKIVGLLVVIGVFSGVCVYLLWPTLMGLKERRDKVSCMNNLQRIAEALNNYAAEHGSYPPSIVYDAAGTPMHSWRVLILAELGYPALYARYDFTKPWDSTENSAIMTECPHVYVSPAADDPFASESSYVLISGKGTVFPKSGSLHPRDIGDGPGNTLLVVEAQNTKTVWTNPIDVNYAKLNSSIGASGPNSLGGDHNGGATAVFADGSPAWLPEDLDPILLDAIITPNGSEPIDPTDYKLR